MKLLNSAYGVVEDGDEIFARFLNTNQNACEKSSDYLHRLQVLLNSAVKTNGLNPSDSNRQLFKQFKRGCWDHTLVLQLELKSHETPDFAELLLQLRTEEDIRATKRDRMQLHFGSSRQTPNANTHVVSDITSYADPNTGVLQAYISETESLRKQVAQVQAQLSTKKLKGEKKSKTKAVEDRAVKRLKYLDRKSTRLNSSHL